MSPSEIRTRILGQHQHLRNWLDRLERVLRENPQSELTAGELRTQLNLLGIWLEEHMRFEEAFLFPVLAAIDAWGLQRVARFEADHVEQRKGLAELTQRTQDNRELWRVTRDLILELRRDMAAEEGEGLRADILRDDVVSIDQASG